MKIPELEIKVTEMLNSQSKALNFDNTIPEDLRKSVVVSIPRMGNSPTLDNQRGIAETCSSAKFFDKVLINRPKPIIDPQLNRCKCGFRAGKSTTEQMIALRCVIDNCRVTNLTASLVFVAFRRAFDTLHRTSIPVVVSQYNVSNCRTSDITLMCCHISSCGSTELRTTKWFMTTYYVLQNDAVSPYLFIVLLHL